MSWRCITRPVSSALSFPTRVYSELPERPKALRGAAGIKEFYSRTGSRRASSGRLTRAQAASGGVHEDRRPATPEDDYTLYSSSALEKENRMDSIEAWIENTIFNSRFLTLMAVTGSLVGSAICFIKGSLLVVDSVKVFVHQCVKGINTGKVIMFLVEALDVYLIATVMLIFGLGLYELFVDTLEPPPNYEATSLVRIRSSSLFGLFPLRTRPKWLEIHSLDEMKTKLGHVIVMILLVGMFEKSKKVTITTATDFFLFSASVALSAVCLYLLSKLHTGGGALEGLRESNNHTGHSSHSHRNGAPSHGHQ